MSDKLLEKLKAQQADIAAQIKAAEKEQAKKAAELRKKRGGVIGLAILAEMESNPQFESTINGILAKNVTLSRDRKLLGLPPLPKNLASNFPAEN